MRKIVASLEDDALAFLGICNADLLEGLVGSFHHLDKRVVLSSSSVVLASRLVATYIVLAGRLGATYTLS